MKLQITVPSKTFILGEYVAVKGGPAIIMSTFPRFKLIATKSTKTSVTGINASSPAGLLLKKYANDFDDYSIQFIDPYQGLGGFGASSAQFVLLWTLRQYLLNSDQQLDNFVLLKEYLQLAWNGKGLPPSGADLISQIHGKICYFHKNEQVVESYSWVFPELAYCLIHTGNKIATHHHLTELKDINIEKLEEIVYAGRNSIQQVDYKMFIKTIKNYAKLLLEQGLVMPETQVILRQLLKQDILAAKGCGALGADIILIIVDPKKMHNLLAWLKQQNFNVIMFGNQLEPGLTFESISHGGNSV